MCTVARQRLAEPDASSLYCRAPPPSPLLSLSPRRLGFMASAEVLGVICLSRSLFRPPVSPPLFLFLSLPVVCTQWISQGCLQTSRLFFFFLMNYLDAQPSLGAARADRQRQAGTMVADSDEYSNRFGGRGCDLLQSGINALCLLLFYHGRRVLGCFSLLS